MKVCKVEGCNNKHHAKGYCSRHYMHICLYGKILKRTQYDRNEIIIKGDIAEILLYNSKCKEIVRTVIDTEDVPKIKEHKWRFSNGYAKALVDGAHTGIPYIILGAAVVDGIQIDHKDRDKLNNRKANLRFCTNAQNCRNIGKPKNNTSGYKGIVWHKRDKKWYRVSRETNCRVD